MDNEMMTAPVRARVRPLGDLAEALNVTRAAVYAAADKGYIGGAIRTGAHRKIFNEAYDYVLKHGYGPGVPSYGQASLEIGLGNNLVKPVTAGCGT